MCGEITKATTWMFAYNAPTIVNFDPLVNFGGYNMRSVSKRDRPARRENGRSRTGWYMVTVPAHCGLEHTYFDVVS